MMPSLPPSAAMHLLVGLLLAGPVARAAGDRVFHDAAGVVSIEAESGTVSGGWEEGSFYTGPGVHARTPGGAVEFSLQISEAGLYRVHLLAARRPGPDPADPRVLVAVGTAGGVPAPAARLRLREHRATAWTDLDADGRPGTAIEFPAPGSYRLRLSAAAGSGFFLDKLVLARNGFVPEGYGPAETLAPGIDVTARGFDPGVVLPPAWAFGVIYGGYTDQAQTLDAIDRLAAGGFPVDAYWIDSWFWDFVNEGRGPGGYLRFEEDKVAFPDVAAMWAEFQRRGIKAGVWIWDCILREGNEAVFDEFHRAGLFGELFINRDRWHNQTGLTICGNIDFERPEAVERWQRKLEPFFAAGLDFLKIDRSSSIAFSRAAFEASQRLGRETGGRGFILAHLHTTHDPRHRLYPTKWSGDAKIAWEQPDYPDLRVHAMGALRENIAMVADPKRTTYAVPFLAHDAGGYSTFNDGAVSDELYTRWLQFTALSPVATLFSFSDNPTRNHPYGFAPATQAIVRRYLQLRLRLFPYLYTHALNTRLLGTRMVRGDGVHEDQYLLGDDLLVAPVHAPGVTARDVHLPAGRWHEWDTGRTHEGGETLSIEAPLERVPLLVRAGALIPLRDPASSIGTGTNARLTLEVFPGADGEFVLREDDGTSNDYLEGAIAATPLRQTREAGGGVTIEILPVEGSFAGMESGRQWTVRLHDQPVARAVRLNGAPLAASHDAVARVVTAVFNGARDSRHVLVFD